MTSKPTITKITIGRLYNLGNYEHVRYELTAEVPQGASAATAVRALENILANLRPDKSIPSVQQLERQAMEIQNMRTTPSEQWERVHGWKYPNEAKFQAIERVEKELEAEKQKREAAGEKAKAIRALFDDLGGAAEYKDAKNDWDTDMEF